MPVELKIDQAALRRVLTGPSSEPVRVIKQAQRQTINAAKMRSPVDTGALRGSHLAGNITIRGDRISTDVTAVQDYAAAVHEGRRRLTFGPRTKKFLSWVGPKGRVFARSVTQPARQPRPWLLNATKTAAGGLGFEVTEGG